MGTKMNSFVIGIILGLFIGIAITFLFVRYNYPSEMGISYKNLVVTFSDDDEKTMFKLPEGYHFEFQGKDLILTED